jgi:hypothetical protein
LPSRSGAREHQPSQFTQSCEGFSVRGQRPGVAVLKWVHRNPATDFVKKNAQSVAGARRTLAVFDNRLGFRGGLAKSAKPTRPKKPPCGQVNSTDRINFCYS